MGQQPPYRPNAGTGSPPESYGYGRRPATPPLHHPVGRPAPAPAPTPAAAPPPATARRPAVPDAGAPARRTAAGSRSRARDERDRLGDDGERDVLGMIVRGTVAAVIGMSAAGVMMFLFFAVWAMLSS